MVDLRNISAALIMTMGLIGHGWASSPPDVEARLGSAVERLEAGGQWHHAIGKLLVVLDDADMGSDVQIGAIKALVEYGDGSVVSPLLRIAVAGDGKVRTLVLESLPSLRGMDPTRAMADGFSGASPDIQIPLLAIIGAREPEVALPLLFEALESEEADVRNKALAAISGRTDRDSILSIAKLLNDPGNIDVDLLREAATDLRRELYREAAPAKLGFAHLLSYHLAESDKERGEALSLLSTNYVQEAIPVIQEALQNPSLADAAVPPAIIAGNHLLQLGQGESAVGFIGAAANAAGRPVPTGDTVSEAMAFLHHGWVTGPLRADTFEAGWEKAWAGEPDLDAIDPPKSPDLGWVPFDASASGGTIDLIAMHGQEDHCFAYAFLLFEMDEAGPATLRIGSDDGVIAWLNGEKVHENRVMRGLIIDNDHAPVTLKEGENRLLLKISQGTAGWGYSVRLTTPDGFPLAATQESVK
ncbi:MAG: hypothetical protein JJU11_09725 [Candidatus Sumerlaeia bacterium]|nr:hypothetical protein [Candidatus Sumerlaeia bacterium]